MTTNVTRFEDRRESDIDFFVHLNDGKYTYRRYKDGRQDALRFGSDWRTTDEMAGDNLIAAMGYLIESQQAQIESLKAQIKDQAQKIMGADNSKQMIQMLRSEKGRDAIKNAIHLLDVKGDPFFSYDNMTALMEVRDMIEDSETPDQRLVDKLKSDDVNGAVRHVIALIPHKGDLLFDLGTMNVMEQLQGMINGQHHPKNDQHFLVIPFTQPDDRYSPKDAEEIMGTMIDSVETEMAVFGKPVAVEMGNEVAARRFLDEPDDVVVMSSKTDIKPTNNTMRND